MRFFSKIIVAIVMASFAVAPAAAQSDTLYAGTTDLSQYDEAVFFFGGRFHQDWFHYSFHPWDATWDDSYILGGGYQRTLFDSNDFRIGAEVGLAGRFASDGASAELWGGAFARYDGFVLGNFRISPSFSIGLSAVTGTQGFEGTRIAQWGKPVPVLIYLGPEIAFSLVDQPQWEAFTRMQHRSGGYGLIADLDASNAVTAGFRFKY